MDEQKKQKVMIGVVAVAVLGAGTFYWVSSQSGAKKAEDTNTGPVVRRKREASATAEKGTKRRGRDAAKARANSGPTTPVRRQKVASTANKATRKKRGRSNKRKTKKVEVLPAG